MHVITQSCLLFIWVHTLNVVTAEAITCNPQVVNGFGFTQITNPTKMFYTCNANYKRFNKGWWGKTTCNDGVWSETPRCIDKNKCGEIPQILHAEMRPQTDDQRIPFVCDKGYHSPDISVITCKNGEWDLNDTTTICKPQCGRRTEQPGFTTRISEGSPSLPGEHPWQVSLQSRPTGSPEPFTHKCGGVLIASCSVLTAAHCINSSRDMQVVLGGVDVMRHEEPDQVISVERHFIHEDYRKSIDNTTHNDIALLQLKVTDSPFCAKQTDFVKTACLPNKRFPDGKECVISGWGSTKDADRPKKLSHGHVSVMSDEQCMEIHGDRLDKTMICAGDELRRVDACRGDSGGPLMCKENGVYYIAGLVSWGESQCSGQKPGVYANVHRYVDWIADCSAHNGSLCDAL